MVPTYAFDEIGWTCADHHFSHPKGRILIYQPNRLTWCNSIERMDQHLIACWNEVVRPDQVVLHLGDFSFHPRPALRELAKRLNGHIVLVRGNHDRTRTACADCGIESHKAVYIEASDGRKIACRHDPKEFTQEEADECELLIHGHLHGLVAYGNCASGVAIKARDVGVDAIDSPYPLEWNWRNLYERHTRLEEPTNDV